LTFNIHRADKNLFVDQVSKGVADPEVIEAFLQEIAPDDPKTARAIPLVMAALGKTEGAARFHLGMRAKRFPDGLIGDIKREAMKQLLAISGKVEEEGRKIMSAHLRKTFAGFPKSITFAKWLMTAQEACQGIAESCRQEITAAKTGKVGGGAELQQLKVLDKPHQIRDQELLTRFGKMSVEIPR
jgi:hypothetical protein